MATQQQPTTTEACCRGYVGNKCAVFPLQLLGFEVDPINSVQFSNHTGEGQVLTGEELWALIEGLEANGLLSYSHLLTGYIGSLSVLDTIKRVVDKLKEKNPNLVYVCDPVLGDSGKLYVKPELVPVFRSSVVSAASLLTPNAFEAEQLTGLRQAAGVVFIRTEEDAFKACDQLHGMGPEKVVITSLEVDDELLVLGSSASSEGVQRFRIRIPKLPAYFTGTGDLFAALLLAHNERHKDFAHAVELTVASMQRTVEHNSGQLRPPSGPPAELRLIQSRDDLLHPVAKARAEIIATQ
eukprot:jgi/Chlat1/274/Chrsp1S03166